MWWRDGKNSFFFFFQKLTNWWQHFLEHLQRCQTRFRRASQLLQFSVTARVTHFSKKFSQIFKSFKVYPQILVWWNMWNHFVLINQVPSKLQPLIPVFCGDLAWTLLPRGLLVPLSLRLLAGIRPALCLLMYWVWQNQSTMNLLHSAVGSNTRALEYENEGWKTFHITAGKPCSQPFVAVKGGSCNWGFLSAGEGISAFTWSLFLLHTLSAEFHQFREPPCSLYPAQAGPLLR